MTFRTARFLLPALALAVLCGWAPHDDHPRGDNRSTVLPLGSEWRGNRTLKGDRHDITARVTSREGNLAVLRTKETDDDRDLVLDWTFEVKDQSIKLKDFKQVKGDRDRVEGAAVGEVRGDDLSADYSWKLIGTKGKATSIEGKLKLHRQ